MDGKKRIYLRFLFIFFVLLNITIHYNLHIYNLNQKEIFYTPSKFVFDIFSPEFLKPLLADYLWIKSANEVIDLNGRDKRVGKRIYIYLMLVSHLDPYFYYPYILGGTILTSKDHYSLFKEGINILKRGIKFMPERWEFYFLIGYYSFFEYNKKIMGLRYFMKCYRLKTTPLKIKKILPFIVLKLRNKKYEKEIKNFLKYIKDKEILKSLNNR